MHVRQFSQGTDPKIEYFEHERTQQKVVISRERYEWRSTSAGVRYSSRRFHFAELPLRLPTSCCRYVEDSAFRTSARESTHYTWVTKHFVPRTRPLVVVTFGHRS
jgi:hypothetical protein